MSSPKVKANRAAKIEKKDKELLQKIDKIIEMKRKKLVKDNRALINPSDQNILAQKVDFIMLENYFLFLFLK